MKKVAFIVLFFISSLTHLHAAPDYIVIKQSWWYGWKIVHVDKPQKKLNKWYYDKKNDTYYRMRSAWGIAIKLRADPMPKS